MHAITSRATTRITALSKPPTLKLKPVHWCARLTGGALLRLCVVSLIAIIGRLRCDKLGTSSAVRSDSVSYEPECWGPSPVHDWRNVDLLVRRATSKLGRCPPFNAAKCDSELARAAETALECDLGEAELGHRHQLLRARNSTIEQVAMRRKAGGLLEGSAEMRRAQPHLRGELG